MFYGKTMSRKHIEWCAKLYNYANELFDGIIFNEDNDIHKELDILNQKFKTEDDIYDKYDLIYDRLIDYRQTKEDAIAFWNTGMWDLCIDRKSISVLPVKIKVDIDVSCLGLDWNGIM